MRILLINDYKYKFGGAEEVLFKTKLLLEQKGHYVKIIGARNKSYFPPILNGWFSLLYYYKTKSIIDEFHPDIIHVHGCIRRISPSPLIAAKKNRIPVIMTFHDFDIFGPEASMITKNMKKIRKLKLLFQRFVIKNNVDFFTSPSKKLCKYIIGSFNTRNVKYIPNFIEIIKYKNSEINKLNKKYFTFVGRLVKEKGLEVLIKAVNIIVRKEGLKETQLYIIGDGVQKAKLIELVNSLNLQKNIKFLGKIVNNKLTKYYKSSLALVIPSIYMETSPLVAYEAMSNKKPIIASNTGGLSDLIEHAKNGYLFKMGDENELASYMKKLYLNKNLSIKLGLYGFQKASREFSRETYYKNLIKVYSNIRKVN